MQGKQAAEYIVDVHEPSALDPDRVGRKFAALATLVRKGYPVPQSVCLTTSGHALWLERGDLTPELEGGIIDRAKALGLENGLAVRSSATLEDLPEASFAGQYESFLDLRSPEELLRAVRACLNAPEKESVKSYLQSSGRASLEIRVAVIIQAMVQARFAGVAFSRNPLGSDSAEGVIEAVPGLGDRLMSGKVSPVRARISSEGDVRMEGGGDASGQPEDTVLAQLGAWLRQLEGEEQSPVDLEWAEDLQGQLWILQLRPAAFAGQRFDIPDGVWTRAVAEDLWADRLTPFMADVMLRNRPRFDFSGPLRFLGVSVPQPSLSVIHGFLYLNCHSFVPLVKAFPWLLSFESVAAIFPPGFRPLEEPGKPPKRTSLLLRGLGLILAYPPANPAAGAFLAQRWLRRYHRRLDRLAAEQVGSASQACKRLDRALSELAALQQRNQWPYLYAAASLWLLRRLLVEGGRGRSRVFLSILRGGGRSVTSRIEQEFGRLAGMVRSDDRLLALFSEHTPQEVLSRLPADFRRELDRFLEAYGCRSGSRTLLSERWVEAPEQVLAMLKALAHDAHSEANGQASPSGSEKLPLWLRPMAAASRSYLDLREELRFALDRALMIVRRSLLDIGAETGLGQDVFFLDRREIDGLLAAGQVAEELKETARLRRRRAERELDPPRFYVHQEPQAPVGDEAERISGLGASPGRVKGRALVTDDPTDTRIEKGDILITKRADPGWTPIFSRIGALAVEEGGLLNHCAIVARELGLPLVVGAAGLTRRISSGDLVSIDGSAGFVEIHQDDHPDKPGAEPSEAFGPQATP